MKRLQETVGVRNANWHHDEHVFAASRFIVYRCFNVNLDINPENSKSFKEIKIRHAFYDENSCRSFPLTVCGMSGLIMTKTWKNLYCKVCSIENLNIAFRKASKGKTKKWYVQEFRSNLENNLLKLKEELESDTYYPDTLHRFVIRDPKTRIIHSPAFRDRVVHHAICNIIEPLFDRTFIHDSYASRKGKGTHLALGRFDEFKMKVSKNGLQSPYSKNSSMIRGWVLKADIRHYFPSINHSILLNLLKRKITDERIISILKKFIEAYAYKTHEGMPLGALTSQLFANIYLNPLDHFIKEKLKAKYYLRYIDDFVILHDSKQQLDTWSNDIKKFLLTKLKLELHPEKTSIFPLHKGVPFLGFRCFYYYRLLKKTKINDFLQKLESAKNDEDARKKLDGWVAHVKWANTYKLRSKIIKNMNSITYSLFLSDFS